jgi:Sulfotransferase family
VDGIVTLPNFLVIGAAKCGTDSLCSYLSQHPDVYMSPIREPNFFMADGTPEIPFCGPGDREYLRDMWVSTLAGYESLFDDVAGQRAIGEGTAWYIYDEGAPSRIRHHVPDAKLIVSLRNPVDRAYSAFTMLLGEGREPFSDFARAIDAEEYRTAQNWEPIWHYIKMGFYADQIRRYHSYFNLDQLKVIIYDDFNSRPREVMQDLFHFLGVDDGFQADTSTRFNVSLVPRYPELNATVGRQTRMRAAVGKILPLALRNQLRRRARQSLMVRPPPIARGLRRRLTDVFRNDILELQDLIGRDLTHWLRCEQ